MDPHTTYEIKGVIVFWVLGPKAKHEITRGQWGKELKGISLQEFLKLFKKTFLPTKNIFHSRAQFFNIKQNENETLDEYLKTLVDIGINVNSTGSHPRKASLTSSQRQ